MRILFVSNYNAWDKVGKGVMPSHHLFGVDEMIDHYVSPASVVLKDQFWGEKLILSSLLTRQNLSC